MRHVSSLKKIFLKNNNGLTLIEAVVAIAMIGIVSVGITTLLFSLSKTSKMSEQYLMHNAICRVIKENVVISARNKSDIHGNTGTIANGPGTDYSGLVVMDRLGNEYPEYSFDLRYTEINEENPYGDLSDRLEKYKITVKNSNNNVLYEFFVEVYP